MEVIGAPKFRQSEESDKSMMVTELLRTQNLNVGNVNGWG